MSALSHYLERYDVPAALRQWIQTPKGHFIDGRPVPDRDSEPLEVVEPSTGGVLTTIPKFGARHLDRAVESARTALTGAWGQMPALERERVIARLADAMEEDAENLAILETLDVGKPIAEARTIDVPGAIDNFRYFAGWASKLDGRTSRAVSVLGDPVIMTVKEPTGVVGAVVPWNFSLQILAWKLAAGLACGCAFIVKPSEATPLSAPRLAELARDAGIPDGVIAVINGVGTDVAAAMVAHPGIDKLTFTGATRTGHILGQTALAHNKRITLELGGKSPVVVTANADLNRAAEGVLQGVFLNSGQVCDAGSRVYADARVAEELLARLTNGAESLAMGAGLDPNAAIAPLISQSHADRVRGHIARAQAEGARLATGGDIEQAAGASVTPTIFADCSQDMAILREEVFGPVLAVATYADRDDAIAKANDSLYGLAAAVYTQDIDEAFDLTRRLRAGNVYVNAHGLIDPTMPFGGLCASGFGKDMGPEQLDGFLETKSVYIAMGRA